MQERDDLDRYSAMDVAQKAKVHWDVKGMRTRNSFMVKYAFFNYYNEKIHPFESHFDVNINSGFTALCPNEALDIQKPASFEEIRIAVWDCGSSVLDKVVSPVQSAFISGRQILDGPLMVSEIIDWYKKQNKNLMIFKEDFEKAFDSRSWIRSCLHSARTSILINGSPTFEFSLGRGLRQGDPLSLFLFILIMKGLKLNISKSNLYEVGVSKAEVHSMALLTGCQAANLLSIGGRLTLIKSVLGSLGIFYMSLFRALKTIINTLERLRARFFWGGGSDGNNKMAWIKWVNVLASYEHGGLEVGSLKAFNLALLQKWRWRFVNNSELLWVKLMKVIHGLEAGFDDLWIGDEPLYSRFNRLYGLDINENCSIRDRFVEGNWSWQWRRPVTSGWTEHMLNYLLYEIQHLTLSSRPNTWKWSIGLDGLFAVGTTRAYIDQLLLPSLNIATRWNTCLPRKMRNPKEIEQDQYNEFYKKTFNKFLDPLAHTNFTTEREVEFKSVVYIPKMAPMNNEDMVNPKTKNICLYVKRVFIFR
uniref:RNA-directed DNA polymerase, eukaryota, reverse transcriptase zinc-binding domain protein n=1 Tax=Tanacetum cinerariifolium TaxID=118510 RepID=A0A699GVF3_TANCI|nr:hypothetical protein [Tanacetum cinerariifolium]